jgi:hypothetical protein
MKKSRGAGGEELMENHLEICKFGAFFVDY